MKPRQSMKPRPRSQRGVALAAIAIFMVVILGFTAIAIDVARLAHTATEVQTVADVAARAGAKALIDNNGTPNTGITRAKSIANDNLMNGKLAPNAEVVVDEGHYNFDEERFECCTNSSPCCKNGSWGDVTCVSSSSCTKRTAVLATPATDVDNLLAGIFDWVSAGKLQTAAVGTANATTTVEKNAIAVPSGPGVSCSPPAGCAANDWSCYCSNGVAPCLPIAAPSCAFPTPCAQGTCQLPALKMGGPGTDTANWHGFQSGHNTADVRAYLRQAPCGTGPGSSPGEQAVYGDSNWVDTTNGVQGTGTNQPFTVLACILQNNLGCSWNNGEITGAGGAVFTIPIYSASNCSSPVSGVQTIVGFSTVRITNVSGSGSNARIDLQTLSNSTEDPTVAGGGCFGTDCRVVLAK
jgi:hypothetical protein